VLARYLSGPLTRYGLIVALIVCGIDQGSKLWLLDVFDLANRGIVHLTPFLDFVLTWNTGISYGLFPQESDFGRFVLLHKQLDPDDDWGVAVVATVGRQLKLRREAVGMRAAEFGKAVGYGEDMVYKIEGGKRIPRPEYLDMADEVLGAGGLLSAMKEDVKRVRYPKKVRDLAQMEARAVEIGVYECSNIAGLLQTPGHARALLESWQPAYSLEDLERLVAARMARLSVFERSPAPALRRPRCGPERGGSRAWRRGRTRASRRTAGAPPRRCRGARTARTRRRRTSAPPRGPPRRARGRTGRR